MFNWIIYSALIQNILTVKINWINWIYCENKLKIRIKVLYLKYTLLSMISNNNNKKSFPLNIQWSDRNIVFYVQNFSQFTIFTIFYSILLFSSLRNKKTRKKFSIFKKHILLVTSSKHFKIGSVLLHFSTSNWNMVYFPLKFF